MTNNPDKQPMVTPFDLKLVEKAMQDYVDGTSDQTLAETARSIIASISNPCAKIFDHKWLDPECVETGCQSLVWKSRYEAAVKGRQEFRQALRDERHTQQTARSAPVVSRENELTPEFRAMTALQKWETLTLQGLLGTDEPWIEHMRQTLREDAARSADGGREALRRADELIRSIQQTPGGQWVVVSDDDEKLVCETDAFVSKALAALTPLTDEPRQDGGLGEALGEEISRKIARVHSSHHDSAIPVTIKISRTYREMEALVQALSRGKP